MHAIFDCAALLTPFIVRGSVVHAQSLLSLWQTLLRHKYLSPCSSLLLLWAITALRLCFYCSSYKHINLYSPLYFLILLPRASASCGGFLTYFLCASCLLPLSAEFTIVRYTYSQAPGGKNRWIHLVTAVVLWSFPIRLQSYYT